MTPAAVADALVTLHLVATLAAVLGWAAAYGAALRRLGQAAR